MRKAGEMFTVHTVARLKLFSQDMHTQINIKTEKQKHLKIYNLLFKRCLIRWNSYISFPFFITNFSMRY